MKPVEKMTGGRSSGDGTKSKKGSSKCALCDKPVVEKYSPFCSKHCADIDLGRWLKGQYAIPASLGGGAGTTEDKE